jgi:endogenous inhibitor of DNA gyrase (YacG/DUF329 family)
MSAPTSSTANFAEKWVRCPGCGGQSLYAPSNLFRPFCSERCKLIDMGAWASEAFAVPAQPDTDPELSEPHAPEF